MTVKTSHPQYDTISPENLVRREHDLEVARSVGDEAIQAAINSLVGISPALVHHIAALGFGDVYPRLGLDPRSRQFVMISVFTALGDCEPQLRIHIGAAPNVGLTREEIAEAVLYASAYTGFPQAFNTTPVAREVSVGRDATN